MLDIEEDSRYEASEKTKVVSIGEWTYYQNIHIKLLLSSFLSESISSILSYSL